MVCVLRTIANQCESSEPVLFCDRVSESLDQPYRKSAPTAHQREGLLRYRECPRPTQTCSVVFVLLCELFRYRLVELFVLEFVVVGVHLI